MGARLLPGPSSLYYGKITGMLYTLTIDLLSARESLIGLHLYKSKDPFYDIPIFTISLGLLFLTISFSFGFRKKEHN
jgi:hypothetical protein